MICRPEKPKIIDTNNNLVRIEIAEYSRYILISKNKKIAYKYDREVLFLLYELKLFLKWIIYSSAGLWE